jgi:flagellar basal-body rod protein FlgC
MPEIKSNSLATMAVASSALRAQQGRMRVIAENIANANSTARTAGGDPYRRQVPVFKPTKVQGAEGVQMLRVDPDQSDFKTEYEPGNPAADAKGYVKLPNVNTRLRSQPQRDRDRAVDGIAHPRHPQEVRG